MISIGLLGFGTVGSGVYELLTKYQSISSCINEDIAVSKILVKNLNKKRDPNVPKELFTNDFNDILNNPKIDIIIEAINGFSPAYSYLLKGLSNGKHVITANKAVVARHLKELLDLAEKKNKAFLFEASAGGGIPIIKPLKHHSVFNKINEIRGILNGTSNFILTQMKDNNLSFEEALVLAQKLGYAEANSSDDVDGYDVSRKLAILSTIAFKKVITEDLIPCRGIRSINSLDIKIFKNFNCTVKLIGTASNHNNRLSASVEPVLVSNSSTLSSIKNACNIISVNGSIVGELHFIGEGAGKNPTSNAIICDLIDIINGSYSSDNLSSKSIISTETVHFISGEYYVRFTPIIEDEKSTLIKLLKKAPWVCKTIEYEDNIVVFTKKLSSSDLEKKLNNLSCIVKDYSFIRLDENIQIKHQN